MPAKSEKEKELESFTLEQIKDYLKKRFYEEEIDPSVSSLHNEPVEAFLIEAFKKSKNKKFKENLKISVSELIYEWSTKALPELNEKEEEYLMSLCTMIAFLKIDFLKSYYTLLSLLQRGSIYEKRYYSEDVEKQLLYALASIQKPDVNNNIWCLYWQLENPEFFGIAFTGLRRSSIDTALDEFSLLIERAKDSFLPDAVWALYHQRPDGKEKLKNKLSTLEDDKKEIVLSALRTAGLEEEKIQELKNSTKSISEWFLQLKSIQKVQYKSSSEIIESVMNNPLKTDCLFNKIFPAKHDFFNRKEKSNIFEEILNKIDDEKKNANSVKFLEEIINKYFLAGMLYGIINREKKDF